MTETPEELCARLREIAEDGDTSDIYGNRVMRAVALIETLAKPASEPAGGVREARQALQDVYVGKTLLDHQTYGLILSALSISAPACCKGLAPLSECQCEKDRLAALSSSAGPAVEPVARVTIEEVGPVCKYFSEIDGRLASLGLGTHDLYAHPAPATVEMREAELLHDFHRQTKQADAARKALSEIIHTTTDEAVLKLARAGIAAVKAAALAPATEGRKG